MAATSDGFESTTTTTRATCQQTNYVETQTTVKSYTLSIHYHSLVPQTPSQKCVCRVGFKVGPTQADDDDDDEDLSSSEHMIVKPKQKTTTTWNSCLEKTLVCPGAPRPPLQISTGARSRHAVTYLISPVVCFCYHHSVEYLDRL